MTNKEIQVGEYVRTKNHGIFKVLELYETEGKYYILNNDKYETYTIGGSSRFDISKEIVNHDFNIIKLIEAGEYVNGYKVLNVGNDYVDLDCNKPSYDSYIFDNQFKSIVTKEQFKSMEYEVGEDDKC